MEPSKSQLIRKEIRSMSSRLGMKIRSTEIVVVGDTAHDIDAAKSLGCRTVGVATGFATLSQLKSRHPDIALVNLKNSRLFLSIL